MFHLHRKHRKFSASSELTIIRLFIAIGLASIETVWSLFMNSLGFSDSAIGFISAGLVIVSVIVAIYSTPILEKFNQNKILIMSMAIGMVSYGIIGFFPSTAVFLTLATVLTIVSVFQTECFDIIFRDNTKKKELSEKEGLLYTVLNVGWLIGPLIAGYVLLQYTISSVFFIASVFFAIAAILLIILHLKEVHKNRKVIDKNIFGNIKEFFKTKKIHLPYILSAGIEVWWAIVCIYLPLFIIKNGLPNIAVGVFMTAITIPLIIIEYPVGKWAGTKGFKPFFYWGYGCLAMISVALFWLSGHIYTQLILIVIASFFVGFLEPIQDTYFFNNVKKDEEEKFYPFYSTAAHAGGLLGKVSIATVLLFLPEQYSYLIIGLFMAGFALLALQIKVKKTTNQKNTA